MPSIKYNPNNTEGAYPESIDFLDTEIKKGERIVATDLVDLYDVEINSPQDGDILYYDEPTELWRNGESSGSSCNIFEGYAEIINDISLSDAKISLGIIHSAIIKKDGTLWVCGYGGLGALGLGDNSNKDIFTQVGSKSDWISVSCGGYHTAAIDSKGTLWITGYNNDGRLGLGDETTRYEFTQVGSDTDWKQVICAYQHTAAIKEDGSLWSTGHNGYGQLGLGDWDDRNIFTQVGSDTNWDEISCGYYHMIVTKTDGTLRSTGFNNKGQLGLGDWTNRNTLIQVGTGTDWDKTSCGGDHTVTIKSDGTLWVCGGNETGDIGLGATFSSEVFVQIGTGTDWDKISCGGAYTMAIKTSGTLWATGYNHYGQLGLGDSGSGTTRTVFTQVGIKTDWKEIECGGDHSMALNNSSNNMLSTGRNTYNQLGINDFTNKEEFTIITKSVSNAVFIDKNTGSPGQGQYDTPFSSIESCFAFLNYCNTIPDEIELTVFLLSDLTITDETSLNYIQGHNIIVDGNYQTITNTHTLDKIVIQISAGWYDSMILYNNGTIWGTGFNYGGKFGIGSYDSKDSYTQEIGLDTDWIFVTTQYKTSMAIKENGTLWGCGENGFGQLGLNSEDSVIIFTQEIGLDTDWKQVSCGGDHTMAVKSDGTLWATGRNDRGQLGLTGSATRYVFTQVGTDTNWVCAKCGLNHTMALKSTGTIWGCGSSNRGQLGIGSWLSSNFSLIQETSLSTNWKELSCYNDNTAAIKSDGTLWGCGDNPGSLGVGDYNDRSLFTQEIGLDTDWKTVDCGFTHTIAIKYDGTLWGCGYDGNGNLGIGDQADYIIVFTQEIKGYTDWVHISCGYFATLALRENIFLMGSGASGYSEMTTEVIYFNKTHTFIEIVNREDPELLKLTNNSAIKEIKNINLAYDLTYDSVSYSIIEDIIYINEQPISNYKTNEYILDIYHTKISNISSATVNNISLIDTEEEIIINTLIPEEEYNIVYVNKRSLFINNRSIINSGTISLDKMKISNATITIDDCTSEVEWDLINDSTLIINEVPTIEPTINEQDSTYIINGVAQ